MYYVLQILGVIAFAASGALVALRKHMDLIGVAVLATVTAIGGGTIRDLLLDRQVFWIREPLNLTVCFISAAVMVTWTRFWKPPENTLGVADAFGLGLFAISGAQIARHVDAAPIIVVLMGTITGVAGGVIRDILSAEIPTVFRQGALYASAAILGIVFYLLLMKIGVGEPIAALIAMGTVVAIRFLSVFYDIELPSLRIDSGASEPEDD